MKKNRLLLGILTSFLVLYLALPAGAWHRTHAEIFAILPNGATGPEGLTVGPDGNVYVATFGFNSSGFVTGNGQIYVFNPQGHLLRNFSVPGSTPFLLGLAFHPTTHELLILDSAAGTGGAVPSKVFGINPVTHQFSVFMTVTGHAGLNALTFDKNGNVYVSDSQTEDISQVEREISYVEPLAVGAERRACREEQPVRHAILAHAVEA